MPEINDLNPDNETRWKYEREEAALLKRLAEVRRVLEALGREAIEAIPNRPPIIDIKEFLEARGEPAHQYEIIKAVGDRRKVEYPHVRNPYLEVWKSLGYSNRHDGDVIPVERKGAKLIRAQLKPKSAKPKRTPDSAEFYKSPDNTFGFKRDVCDARAGESQDGGHDHHPG